MRRKDEPGWLRRAVTLSLLVHAAGALVAYCGIPHGRSADEALVDVELAPEAPEAQKLADVPDLAPAPAPPQTAPAEPEPPAPTPSGDIAIDAGVPDAQRVARADAGGRDAQAAIDAGLDAGLDGGTMIAAGDGGVDDGGPQVASGDGGVDDGGAQVAIAGDGGVGDGGVDDGGTQIATAPGGAGAGSGTGDVPGGAGSGSGSDGDLLAGGDRPHPGADDGVATGTAANLLSYFPSGHVVTLLIRFDRLRGTEWAAAGEKVLEPMPDYQTIVGARKIHISDLFATLVISTPSPKDIVATTLVGRTERSGESLRELLDQPDAPVAWQVARGGALGRRGAGDRVFPGDPRVFLMPYPSWIVLAQPRDLGDLTRPASGDLDRAVAQPSAIPPWLARVKTIEAESGAKDGPELLLTMSALAGRYDIPDLGWGIASLPAPDRITLALQIDAKGMIARGNLRFATDADAEEMVQSATKIRTAVADSRILQAVLRRTSALNLIQGLTMVRTRNRVAYATSLSTADARMFMEFAAKMLTEYYARQRVP